MSERDAVLKLDFEALFDAAPDAVIVHDLDARLIYWNRAAEALYGWTSEEMQGRPLEEILYPEHTWDEGRAILEKGGVWRTELRQIKRDGEFCYVRHSQSIHDSETGTAPCAVAFVTDITAQTLEARAHAEEVRVESSQLLAGGIAHELNNALAPILLSAAMLQRLVESDKARSMAGMIEKCANKGSSVITELLAYERGRMLGGSVIRGREFKRAIERLSERMLPDSIRVHVEIEDGLWEFRGDFDALQESIGHLMQNALEAMPNGGQLTIRLENQMHEEQAYVCWVLDDNGCGIDASILSRVSEPYYSTKSIDEHDGFGLSKVQAVVLGHKGFMTLESRVGEGTTVRLYLPAKAPKREVEVPDVSEENVSKGNGERVLVVETDVFVREVMRIALEEANFRVSTAENGRDALALYKDRSGEIDVVITQLEMSHMDGLALRKALQEINPSAKVLIASGDTGTRSQRIIDQCGELFYIQKPFTAAKLVKRVSELLVALI